MRKALGVRAFDLLAVGGGSAGFAAALRGAQYGARVGLVEASTLGGTCVNVGCVPSKTLIRAAEANHRRSHHGFDGIAASNGGVQWPAVREQKDALVARLRQAKYRDVLDAHAGVTLIAERAELIPGVPAVRAGGHTLRAEKVILATGASPWSAPIPGLDSVAALDSASAMDMDQLPECMIVIGGSAVGLELAQMFARLGVRVAVIEAMPRLLPAEDPAVGDARADYLRQEGIGVRTGVAIQDVARTDGRAIVVRLDNGTTIETLTAEKLLVATGRRANTRGLGLEGAGVQVGERGEILVDEYLRTSASDIYAAGDVTGEPMFVYVAARAGATAAENALNGDAARYDLTALPRVTFTDPAVATVGLTDPQARAAGIRPITVVLPLEHLPRALAAHDTRGFIKLVADRESRQLIGAHAPAYAQAVCSAPHSAPTVTQSGIGVHPFGSGIVLVTAYHSESTNWFGPNSRSTALPLAGDATTTSLYVTTVFGIGHGMEVWLQLPVHRVRYRDSARNARRSFRCCPRWAGGCLIVAPRGNCQAGSALMVVTCRPDPP